MYTCSQCLFTIAQEMFLGRLSMIEAGKLSERVLKFVMLKLVFMAAVSGPELPEIVMWVTWYAPYAQNP